MSAGKIILVTGGTRSGKSEFAELYCNKLGREVLYIATAAVFDGEMAKRVEKHRVRRPSCWKTIEEQFDVAAVIQGHGEDDRIILLDCLTFLITNHLLREELPEDEEVYQELEKNIINQITALLRAAREKKSTMVVVSNESGLGLIPPDRLSRKYQELVGLANQYVAREADEVYLVMAGLPIEIKGNGVEIIQKIRGEV